MEIMSKEINSGLTKIGSRHICSSDKYVSCFFFSDRLFDTTKIFPISISKYSFKHYLIIEVVWVCIPEHSLIFHSEFLEFGHSFIVSISPEKSKKYIYTPFFPSHTSRSGREATENFVSFSSPWIRIQTGVSPTSDFSR